MRIYLAGERANSRFAAVRNQAAAVSTRHVKRRLFSFYRHGFSNVNYLRDPRTGLSEAIADAQKRGCDLMLDSGAFTAFTKGVTIPCDEYARYVNKYRHAFSVCASIDVIGRDIASAQGSFRNLVKLRRLGADVLPIWHVREGEDVLDYYVQDGEPYIGIGGMVPEKGRAYLQRRLDHVWANYLTNADGRQR